MDMTDFHVMAGAGGTLARPEIRRIGVADLVDAIKEGLDDFREKPSHYVFLCLIYPIVGVFLFYWSTGANAIQLIYPLMSGFALLGPLAAIGLYEISRRRELGMDTSWSHAFEVRHSPAIPSIIALGILLVCLFLAWLFAAQEIYTWNFGDQPPVSIGAFVSDVFGTTQGWNLIVAGNLVGLLFAIVALATTVIAFPILLDRDVGIVAAVETSARAVAANPVQMALWGLIVVAGLAIGSVLLFAGLAVVIPVLGHATWHLYRKLVAPEPGRARRVIM
jgi:uncharacterized membrane protein